jgi:hypothetical protein
MIGALSPNQDNAFLTVSVRMRGVAQDPRQINPLRGIRKSKRRKLREIAARLGTTIQSVARYERGERRVTLDQVDEFAAAYEVEPLELLRGVRRSRVVGAVDAGGTIGAPPSLMTVRCPPQLDNIRTEALIAVGPGLAAFPAGWFLLYERPDGDPVPDDALNQLCVVELAEGGRFVRQLRRGYQPGRYNLLGMNAVPADDVAVRWAAPVRAILAPDLAEQQTLAPDAAA